MSMSKAHWPPAVLNVQRCFEQLNSTSDFKGLLSAAYSNDVHFEDPLHQIKGIDRLADYCSNLYENLIESRFEYRHSNVFEESAILFWTMHIRHKRLNGGKLISIDGVSHIHFDDRVYYHRDYFDSAQMIWKQIPVLGTLINKLEKRL